jgi:putative transposase
VHAGIDIGVKNLAATTSDKAGFLSHIVNGRPVKSINQFYKKRKAVLQRKLGKAGATAQMERLTAQRTRQIDHYLHTASRRIIDLLVAEGIGALVIGRNPRWKQEANLGRRGNQNFVGIPHARYIAMLSYKAEVVGVQVLVSEERYTSKASLLDGDPLPVYAAERKDSPIFSGRRVTRVLYRSASDRRINADVSGAYTIIRQAFPDQGIAGAAVRPVRLPVRTKRAASSSSFFDTVVRYQARWKQHILRAS